MAFKEDLRNLGNKHRIVAINTHGRISTRTTTEITGRNQTHASSE
jgi:hypothetical protein